MKTFLLSTMFATAGAAHWAVIMAGSNTYGNYRHQADACHAYQIAKKNGIPESNIIMIAYDDIANSPSNPFPGKVFNKPTAKGVPGVDVYDGCKISYRGKDVTASTFLKVLSGDASAGGPVLKSTAQDHVFVYYADHGGPGILGVPTGAAGGYIHAADINKALETLHTKGGYKELMFYLEACESGSIFNKLLKAPNVKAVTAANPTESSWGWYCMGKGTGGDMVDGTAIGSCLGDEFSVRWMEDTDAANLKTETVAVQFGKVKAAVNKSHVQAYGVSSFDSEPIGDFEGIDGQVWIDGLTASPGDNSGVDSRQVEVHQAYYKVSRSKTPEARKEAEDELAAILAKRQAADSKFAKIASVAANTIAASPFAAIAIAKEMLEGPIEAVENVECHKASLESVVQHCGSFNDYSLRYSRLFVNLCGIMNEKVVLSAIEQGCASDLKLKKASEVVEVQAAPTGKYTASVPFILTMTLNFNDDGTMDFDNNVKVAHQEINCPKTKVAITDTAVTFPNIGNTGDCMGDALRGQKKDVTKFKIDINSDGTLTFHSDGWPDLKLKKASEVAVVV